MPIRHILCPVDFSEDSRTALRYACALASKRHADVTVLFVNDPLLGTAAAAAAYDVKALQERTVAELGRFVARAVGNALPASVIVTAFGHPPHEIQKTAERLRADLVVLGSRGRTGPAKWLFGSVTERVLRTATIPVLVVPRHKRRSRARWASAMRSWPGKRIVVPIDLHDYALSDVRQAMDAVGEFGAKAVVVSVLSPVQFPPWLRFDSRSYDRQRIVSARAELDKLITRIGEKAECRVVIGDPAAEIAACAADTGAGLVVLTLKRAAAPFGPRQGAITYRLLSMEAGPILALPQKSRRS